MAHKPLSEVDKLELQIIAEAIAPPGTPPCQAARSLLTGGHFANIEAIRNGGVPVAVSLPNAMELPSSVSLIDYMEQLMQNVRK